MTAEFTMLTTDARKALASAERIARQMRHPYIGTEHLLLALASHLRFRSMLILDLVGVEAPKIKAALEFILGSGTQDPAAPISLTPAAKEVLKQSENEAHRLGQWYVDTEHLLLGLTHETKGIAYDILESLGVTRELLRRATMDIVYANLGSAPIPIDVSKIEVGLDLIKRLTPQEVLSRLLEPDAPEFWDTIKDRPELVRALVQQLAAALLES